MRSALRRLPKGKAVGIDELPAELLKTDNEGTVKWLTRLCNTILATYTWPEDWLRSVFITIPKTPGTNECEEHRTIALICHTSKILLRILLQRQERLAEEQYSEHQMGFRKNVGTRDQIFNLRMIVKKSREFNIPLYFAFIDYKKAFDSLNHKKLWKVLKAMGIRAYAVKALKSLYDNQEAAVRYEDELTDWFKIGRGSRQGCLTSPMLFNLYSEKIMRESVDELNWIGLRISGRNFNNLRFADDIVLISTSPIDLQRLIDEVDRISTRYNLEISTKKTKVMAACREPEVLRISCRGKILEQVHHFKYLGAMVDETADCTRDIKARLGAARSALSSLTKIWKDRALCKRIKLKVLKTLVWPVALYGCEAWTLKASDTNRLHAFEMACYRRLLRINWRDHRTNISVLEEINTTRQFVSTIRKRKLQYFGHVIRAQNISTHILEGRVDGARGRGRPKRRWMDDVKDWTGETCAACTAAARDRRLWRTMAHAASIIPDPQP